jgi:putative ATP-dependent endonuclease of OLD family
MLFSKAVILVEGAAEQFIMPAFANTTHFDLDSHNVIVCAVQRNDFLPHQRLLRSKGLNIPHVIITDGDPGYDGTLAGVARGCKLLRLTEDEDHSIVAGDMEEAVDSLRERDVFVGRTTLELGLLPAARAAMMSAYEEIEGNHWKRSNFELDINAYIDGGDRGA